MALVVKDTAGAADANAFCDVAYGDTFFEGVLNASSWTGASAAEKAQAIVHATRVLNTYTYDGVKTTTVQALEFPRFSIVDRDGWLLDSATIPECVKRATSLLALELLKAGTNDPFAVTSQDDIASLGITGGVAMTFRDRTDRPVGLFRFPAVMAELRTVLLMYGQGTTLARG